MNDINAPSDQLAGAWELIAGSYTGEDGTVVDYAASEVRSLKVLSESRFSFVSTSGGTFYAAGAGEYTAALGIYAEMPSLVSHAEMLGQRYEFQYQLDGDTWTNSRWKEGIRVEHEVWRRVKA